MNLVCLLQSIEERLKTSKVPDKFEDPEDPHDSDQPDHLACLANDLKVLQALQQQGQVEGNDGQEVNHVHWALHELELVWADDKSDQILQGEEDDHKVIDEVNDVGQELVFDDAIRILLQLLSGGDDEGDGGDEDHGQGEKGQELSQFAGPGILYGVPEPGSPSAPVCVAKVLLCCLLKNFPLLLQVSILFTLKNINL